VPVLGAERADHVVAAVDGFERGSVRELAELLTA
jgi:hypothetical protein